MVTIYADLSTATANGLVLLDTQQSLDDIEEHDIKVCMLVLVGDGEATYEARIVFEYGKLAAQMTNYVRIS